jgi:heme a synthase
MIWVGGLVTSYGAGMAVPDWPNTYGYNLFLYPWQTWVFGPWKLFIEHGHRLLGTLVGMIAICLVISACCSRCRTSVRVLSGVALVGVIFQGALGGLRVIEDATQLAMIHGCVGPAFFAFAVALATVSSGRWLAASREEDPRIAKIERLAISTTLLSYVQLVLGSQLRHLTVGARAGDFRVMLFFHLAVAATIVLHVVLMAVQVYRSRSSRAWLARPAIGLLVLIVLQVCLGAETWIAKYGWPAWMSDYQFAAAHVVGAESREQTLFATAHVATGSLVLAVSLLTALRSARLAFRAPQAAQPKARLVGSAL